LAFTTSAALETEATIPTPVREALGLGQGDRVAFIIQDGEVSVRRAAPIDRDFALALDGSRGHWTSL
jgi:antitoxin PrlF